MKSKLPISWKATIKSDTDFFRNIFLCQSVTYFASLDLKLQKWNAKISCKLQEEKIPPKPYVYEYGGVDASGLAAAKTESQDADGVVHGKTNVLFSIKAWLATYFELPHLQLRNPKSLGTWNHAQLAFVMVATSKHNFIKFI